ncbi:MAG: hypothetical protein CM15mP58_13470 [Burkholderiaceae bacterium]|nr:MAG: hypothetical protein CM15mP58_13470 [Burkholderiaceae bacterium]
MLLTLLVMRCLGFDITGDNQVGDEIKDHLNDTSPIDTNNDGVIDIQK